jgi:general secretion pathway protein A
MYLDYWNLREAPFQNVADARFAYLCDQHHEGLARLVYLVENRKLGGILTGPYGVGKTMVLEMLDQEMQKDKSTRYIHLDYHPGSSLGLARQLATMMRIRDQVGPIDEAGDLLTYLKMEGGKHGHTTLVIDEAQIISSPEVYHFLHLLMNLTLQNKMGFKVGPAFTVILSGYTDMTRLLRDDESMCQRLQMVWHLDPLNDQQILEYVQHRIRVAGGDIWLFEKEAIFELAKHHHIPRRINNICDVALMLGYASNQGSIGRNLILQAIEEANSLNAHLGQTRSSVDENREQTAS